MALAAAAPDYAGRHVLIVGDGVFVFGPSTANALLDPRQAQGPLPGAAATLSSYQRTTPMRPSTCRRLAGSSRAI